MGDFGGPRVGEYVGERYLSEALVASRTRRNGYMGECLLMYSLEMEVKASMDKRSG